MQLFPPTLIIRHKKENLKKCSLRGLELRSDCVFFKYPLSVTLPSLDNYFMLSLDAPIVTESDSSLGIILLDGTWKYAEKMEKIISPLAPIKKRSLPKTFKTAYPRRQDDCKDPTAGLASVEALYITYHLLKRETSGLLDNYYWKEAFLNLNHHVF